MHRYAAEAAAREAIEDRDVYGAFVAAPGGAKVLTSSAASPAVAQLLSHAASESGASTQDVVAAPRGAALASSVLPLVNAGILTGVAAAFLATGALGRVALVLTASVLAGLVAMAIVQGWLEVIDGDWAANAAALSLTVLAIGSVVAGLKALLGERGIALGALTMVFVGNPFSGVGSAPELLPQPVGGIGQLLPPGAGGNLLRSTGCFDGAGAGGHVAVLAAWALGGLGLLLAAEARRARGVRPGPSRRCRRDGRLPRWRGWHWTGMRTGGAGGRCSPAGGRQATWRSTWGRRTRSCTSAVRGSCCPSLRWWPSMNAWGRCTRSAPRRSR